MPAQNILVVGGTGVIGVYIVNSLLNAGVFRVAVFTSPGSAVSKKEQLAAWTVRGAEILVGDLFDEATMRRAFSGFDTVVSAVGRNAIHRQIDLLRWAAATPSVQRFLPSEYGTDIAYDTTSADEKPHQKKLAVRAFAASDAAVARLAVTYVVTGPFADLYIASMGLDAAMGEFHAGTRTAALLGDGDGEIALTTMADVGRAVVGVLRNTAATDGTAVRVHSFVTTPHRILAEFERQTERKWTVAYTSLDELRKLESAAWLRDDPVAGLWTLNRIWTEGKTLYETVDNGKIGLDKTDTLEMQVAAAVANPVYGFHSTNL